MRKSGAENKYIIPLDIGEILYYNKSDAVKMYYYCIWQMFKKIMVFPE